MGVCACVRVFRPSLQHVPEQHAPTLGGTVLPIPLQHAGPHLQQRGTGCWCRAGAGGAGFHG